MNKYEREQPTFFPVLDNIAQESIISSRGTLDTAKTPENRANLPKIRSKCARFKILKGGVNTYEHRSAGKPMLAREPVNQSN